MPDSGAGRVHRLSWGCVEGVRWRPTRFAVETLHPYACSLCGVITRRTVLLPCTHALCGTCKGDSGQDGGVCPLDQESFEEEECNMILMPAKKISNIKAYCWNQAQGCTFLGPLPTVLRHYEEECFFHAVECPKCGVSIPHASLAAHCTTGCCNAATISHQPPLGDGVLYNRDINATLEEFRGLLRQPYQDQLPALQRKMNELTEQLTNQAALLQEIASKSREKQMGQHWVTKNVGEEVSTKSSNLQAEFEGRPSGKGVKSYEEESWDRETPIPWRLEKKHILRKLEIFANESLAHLADVRQASLSHVKDLIIRRNRVDSSGWREADSLRESLFATRRLHPAICYRFDVKNAGQIFSPDTKGRKVVAEVTEWYTRDVYFTMAIMKNGPLDRVEICFRSAGTLDSNYTELPVSSVSFCDEKSKKRSYMNEAVECSAWDRVFWSSLSVLKDHGFFKGGQLTLDVILCK